MLRSVGSSLSSLSRLRWLDLSFNHLQTLDGLECLSNLTDLSVSHNQLTSFRGLEGCNSLSIVAATHNRISGFSAFGPLRLLQQLRCLCIAGNPFCSSENSRGQLLSLLPSLTYLDFKLLSAEEKATAAESLLPEQHQQQVELLKALEAKAKQQQEQQLQQQKQQQQQQTWFELQEDLAAAVFGEETIPAEVTCLNCLPSHRDAFFHAVAPLIAATRKALEDKGLALQRRMASFGRAARALEEETDKSTIAEIRRTDTQRRAVLDELQKLREAVVVFLESEADEGKDEESVITSFSALVSSLSACPVASLCSGSSSGSADASVAAEAFESRCASLEASFRRQQETVSLRLLQQEQQLSEAVAAATAALEAETDAASKHVTERAADLFRQLEIHLKAFASQLASAASQEIAAFLSSEGVEDTDPRAQEDVIGSVGLLGEQQQQALSAAEDRMQQQLQQQQKCWFDAERRRQSLRNRQRIRELHSVAADSQQQVAAAAASVRGLLASRLAE
ncbi:hypothetical protein Efla_005077 [Eimeria flavescens]